MPPRLFIDIKHLQETLDHLKAVKSGVQPELVLAMAEAMEPIHEDTATYPDVPHPTRKGTYGRTQVVSYRELAGAIEGKLDFPVPYAVYLRGTPDGSYGGAWMHTPYWTSLASIIAKHLPRAREILQKRIDALIARIMGASS